MNLFSFSHFVQAWILPPGFFIFLILCGFFLLNYRLFLGKSVILITAIIMWLCSAPIIAQKLIDPLQQQFPPLKISNVSNKNTAIVILGGSDTAAPIFETDRAISYDSLSRLSYASYLYSKTHLPIIVSGGSPSGSNPEADLMKASLKNNFNVPTQWKESASINTADESRFLVPLLQKNKIDTIYLVTHAWHMPRSIYIFNATFKNTGLKVIPAPMGYIELKKEIKILNYLPSLEALNTSTTAIHEYIGLLWYYFYYVGI